MTIEELSQRIGVSTATVSGATYGRGCINPYTRAMVLDSMTELGRVPDLHAEHLVTISNCPIGTEFPGNSDKFSNVFFSSL